MRLFEIEKNKFHPYLVEFWRSLSPRDLSYYLTRDNCYEASEAFAEWVSANNNENMIDVIPMGRLLNNHGTNKMIRGWFKADTPDLSLDALSPIDEKKMIDLNLNPFSDDDRLQYITDNNLEEEFSMIPHSWTELHGEILDPSGFYVDGKSGQFDTLVNDKSQIASRYHYFR